MSTDLRHRLRAAAARHADPLDPPHEGTRRHLTARVALDRVVLLFHAYGLHASAGGQESNIVDWRFYLGQRVLIVADLPRSDGVVSGKLQQAPSGDNAGGAVTSAPVSVTLCELVWDPSERVWYGADGQPAVNALLAGILDALD